MNLLTGASLLALAKSIYYTVMMTIFLGGKLLPLKYPKQNPDYLFPRYGIGKSAALKKYASSTLLREQAA